MRRLNKIFFYLISMASMVGSSTTVQAQDPVLSSSIQMEGFEYLKTDSNVSDVESARTAFTSGMKALNKPSLSLGYFAGTAWLRFQIKTNLPPETRLRLYLDSSFLEDVRLYSKQGDQVEAMGTSGIRHPMSQRSLSTRFPSFEMTAGEARSHVWMLSIQSTYPISSIINVQTIDEFYSYDHTLQMFVGFFAGAFIVMAAYNLFLYFSLRDRSYLYYSLAIFLTHGMVILGNFGIVNEYFWPENPWLMKHHFTICEGLALVCNSQLTRLFFDTKNQSPRYNYAAWFFTWVGAGLAVISLFIFPAWLPKITNLALGLGILTIICLGAHFARKGSGSAKLFLLSWTPLLIGGVIVIIAVVFSLEITKVFKYVVLVGALFECIVLSLALGYRYRLILLQKKMVELENRYMMTEMESAKEIQDALMPQSFQVPGMNFFHYYKSADRTGGDLYGYHHNKESDIVFVFIGDVTGHGLSSALVTSNISGSIYSSLRDLQPEHFDDLESYMNRIALNINDELIRVCNSQKLSTFLMVAFDLKNGDVVQLNAGHLPILHLSEGKVKAHAVMGSPLGLTSEPRLGFKRFSLKEQDMLLLVTDGVVEQKELNMKKLSRLFEGSSEAADIHSELKRRVELNTKFEDDVTWLLIQWRKDPAAELETEPEAISSIEQAMVVNA